MAKIRGHEEAGVVDLNPLANSHGRTAVKCAFCDKPAVTVVKGYPVCQEHADMLYKKAMEPAPAPGRAPKMGGAAPAMGTKKLQKKA